MYWSSIAILSQNNNRCRLKFCRGRPVSGHGVHPGACADCIYTGRWHHEQAKKVPADQSLILRDSFSTVEDEFEIDERPVCRDHWLTGLLGILYFLGKPTVWAPVILWSGRNFRASPSFGLSIDTRNTVAKPSEVQYK